MQQRGQTVKPTEATLQSFHIYMQRSKAMSTSITLCNVIRINNLNCVQFTALWINGSKNPQHLFLYTLEVGRRRLGGAVLITTDSTLYHNPVPCACIDSPWQHFLLFFRKKKKRKRAMTHHDGIFIPALSVTGLIGLWTKGASKLNKQIPSWPAWHVTWPLTPNPPV